MESMRIKVIKGGPYHVSGAVPLDEKIVRPQGQGYVWEDGRELEQKSDYYLCRCGHSSSAPFCDGTHKKRGFVGAETASTDTFDQRAETIEGKSLTVRDDKRCAFVRFCHAENAQGEREDIWSILAKGDSSGDSTVRELASACPAGRLNVQSESGELLEPELKPGITVVQDPEQAVSAGLYVHGYIPLESADGEEYELRNRYMLCRCGLSREKPICDATHVPAAFDDGHIEK